MTESLSNVWPAILLAIGFPLTLLVLNEVIGVLRGVGSPLVRTLVSIRTLVVPTLAVLIFVRLVLELPADHQAARIIATLFWVLLLYAVLGAVNLVVFELGGADSWRRRVPGLFLDLARAALVAIGAVVVYSQVWGQEITGALTALGLGSIVVGLALQEPLGNLVSGLMLLFERPLAVGDWLETNEVRGKIIEINWRAVHLETDTRELHIVPNVSLYKSAFSNLSRPSALRTARIAIGFGYDDAPNRVKALMLELLGATPGVLADPPPRVETMTYGDFAITYDLIFTVSCEDELPTVRDAVMTRLWYLVRRAGLSIPYPISQEFGAGEAPGQPPPDPALWLADFPGFLPAATTATGRAPVVLDYACGEDVQRAGERFGGFALVLRGRARLLATDRAGRPVAIGEIGPGECFGTQLTAGAAADDLGIQALEDLKVMRFDPRAIGDLLNRAPALAAEIGEAVEARRRAAQAARQG